MGASTSTPVYDDNSQVVDSCLVIVADIAEDLDHDDDIDGKDIGSFANSMSSQGFVLTVEGVAGQFGR